MAPKDAVGATLQRKSLKTGNLKLLLKLGEETPEPGYGKVENEQFENPESVNVKTASAYLFGCCFYNCCFPCLSRCFGPWCGNKFCFKNAWCFKFTARRDRWLYSLHCLCFLAHASYFVATIIVANGKDMLAEAVRVKSDWVNQAEYTYTVGPSNHQILHMDRITMWFFGLSAIMHAMWIICSPFEWSKPYLWRQLDNCFCWWRWLEYSASASLMVVAISLVLGLREQNTLLAIFSLCAATMCCGLMTEMVSRPAKKPDGKLDYDRWEGDPLPDDNQNRLRARVQNYAYRMLPHLLGFIPYFTLWAIIINNFFEQIDDLCEEAKDAMPDFVPWIVFGCCALFSVFTFVQWR